MTQVKNQEIGFCGEINRSTRYINDYEKRLMF